MLKSHFNQAHCSARECSLVPFHIPEIVQKQTPTMEWRL